MSKPCVSCDKRFYPIALNSEPKLQCSYQFSNGRQSLELELNLPQMDGDETFSRGLLDLRDEFILTAVAASEAGFTTEGKLKGGRLLTTSEYNLALYRRDLKNLKFED